MTPPALHFTRSLYGVRRVPWCQRQTRWGGERCTRQAARVTCRRCLRLLAGKGKQRERGDDTPPLKTITMPNYKETRR